MPERRKRERHFSCLGNRSASPAPIYRSGAKNRERHPPPSNLSWRRHLPALQPESAPPESTATALRFASWCPPFAEKIFHAHGLYIPKPTAFTSTCRAHRKLSPARISI